MLRSLTEVTARATTFNNNDYKDVIEHITNPRASLNFGMSDFGGNPNARRSSNVSNSAFINAFRGTIVSKLDDQRASFR